MNKTKKTFAICVILTILILGIGLLNNCFGATPTPVGDVVPPTGSDTTDLGNFKNAAENIWGVARLILQVAALTAFIWVGVKYMFASADGKGDLKKSFTIVIIGALITFGSTIAVEIILKIFEDIAVI